MPTDLAALSAAATEARVQYENGLGSLTDMLAGAQIFLATLETEWRTGNLVQSNREGMRERVQRAICAAIMGPQFSPIGDEFKAEADAAIAAILGGEHDK